MKNKDKSKSRIVGTTPKSKLEADETELSMEKGINLKIAVKAYQKPERLYFSSPCLLSEMEDTEDAFNF
jgi:hypothetical protein